MFYSNNKLIDFFFLKKEQDDNYSIRVNRENKHAPANAILQFIHYIYTKLSNN